MEFWYVGYFDVQALFSNVGQAEAKIECDIEIYVDWNPIFTRKICKRGAICKRIVKERKELGKLRTIQNIHSSSLLYI